MQLNISTEKHPIWLQLLFNIITVFLYQKIINFFSISIEDNKHTAPFCFVIMFFAIYHIWQSMNNYSNRFGQLESFVDSSLYLFECVIIACISVSVEVMSLRDNHKERLAMSEFAIGLALAHAGILLANLRVFYLVKGAQGFPLILVISELVSISVWLISGLVHCEKYIVFVLWAAAVSWEFVQCFLYELYVSYFPFKYFGIQYNVVPLNVNLAAERLGLLVIIAIGETVAVVFGSNLTDQTYGGTILTILQGFLFKFAYFDVYDCTGDITGPTHAMKVSKLNGSLFMKLHECLVGAILVASMYLRYNFSGDRIGGIAYSELQREGKIYRQLVYTISVGLVMLFCYGLSVLHVRTKERVKTEVARLTARGVFTFGCSAILCLMGGFVEFEDTLELQALALVIFGICICFEFMCKWLFLDIPVMTEVNGRAETHVVDGLKIDNHSNNGSGLIYAGDSQNFQSALQQVPSTYFLSERVSERCKFENSIYVDVCDSVNDGQPASSNTTFVPSRDLVDMTEGTYKSV